MNGRPRLSLLQPPTPREPHYSADPCSKPDPLYSFLAVLVAVAELCSRIGIDIDQHENPSHRPISEGRHRLVCLNVHCTLGKNSGNDLRFTLIGAIWRCRRRTRAACQARRERPVHGSAYGVIEAPDNGALESDRKVAGDLLLDLRRIQLKSLGRVSRGRPPITIAHRYEAFEEVLEAGLPVVASGLLVPDIRLVSANAPSLDQLSQSSPIHAVHTIRGHGPPRIRRT